MIEAAHRVLLGGRSIGTILQRGDVARFVFGDDYWASRDRPVLGTWFEDNPRTSPQAALRLPPWFSNLLPEGRLRQWIAHERGVRADQELQLLLQIGADLPGAVEVVPFAGDAGDVGMPRDGEERERGGEVPGRWKFSLAGVGLKFSLLRDGDRLTIPGSDELGDWIVKLPDPEFAQVPANEFGMMRLASRIGIEIPEIDLVHRDQLDGIPPELWSRHEEWAFAIRRFDRTASGGRVHIEDFAQVRGWYADAKYDGSFDTVAALAFRRRDTRSLREFVRRLTFFLLIGNGDAHLKNWSFIYPDGRIPTLSPAYDIVSTGAYYPPDRPDTTGLRFGGTRSFDRMRRDAFVRLQQRLSVGDQDVLDVVDETIERFHEEWRLGPPETTPSPVVNWVSAHAERQRRRLGS